MTKEELVARLRDIEWDDFILSALIRCSCIHVFDDRIEFLNPGGMPMPLDIMENSFESQPRNPIIAKLFRLAHISENLGYGLRKLKRWQEVTGRTMHIDTSINSVKVTFDLQTRDTSKINVPVNAPVKLTETQKIVNLVDKINYFCRPIRCGMKHDELGGTSVSARRYVG